MPEKAIIEEAITPGSQNSRNGAKYLVNIALQVHEQNQIRYGNEINASRHRSKNNLVLGVLFAAIGFSFLAWAVLKPGAATSGEVFELVGLYLPRAALCIPLEMVAFFFFGLYKKAFDEIRYYHNELNLQELRVMVVMLATAPDCNATITSLVSSLLTTGQNLVLTKDQTTPEIESKKLENQSNEVALRSLSEVVKSFSPAPATGKTA